MSGPFPDSPNPTRFHELLRRLQGIGGYSADPDSLRDNELAAQAVVMAEVSHAIDRAAQQGYPDLADELLEEWERIYRLPNDAARTVAERLERLAAAERATGGASEPRFSRAVRTVADDVADPIVANSVTMVNQDAAEKSLIFQPAVQISEAEFADPAIRRAVGDIAQRVLPARSWGQHGVPVPAESVVVKLDAEWASVDHRLDRDGIRQQTATAYATRPGLARHRSYGPATRLRSTDLNEIQERMLLDSLSDDDGDTYAAQVGADRVALSVEAALGTNAVDASMDWRDRFVLVAACVHAADDIRPGQASDSGFSTGDQHHGLWYTGTGGTGGYRFETITSLFLQVNATTGALEVENGTGATAYIVAILQASQDLGKR